ncbi:hypothetical protein [Streptomyces sp. B1I3]|uniref:hypothetical protein n=1 Tax=Streptomyces sp. B1I3 TaxID=3042264 RepID=UPI00278321D8|nr:hypothetical protein [Streptomyces sp. B1I3]MDQ0791695.1 hypothetical protein [Streptomyces sp. B1I3]
MKITTRFQLAATLSGAALLGTLLSGSPSASAAAAKAAPRVEVCTEPQDTRSTSDKTAVEWRMCLDSYSGVHGSLEVKCLVWSLLNGWHESRCQWFGGMEILKGDEVIEERRIGLASVSELREVLRFNCQEHGTYNFAIRGIRAQPDYPNADYLDVTLPDTTVTAEMC